MDFHMLNCYGALLFALGLVEVASVTPYDVTSITSGSFSGGFGCLAFIPMKPLDYFEFIAGTEQHYTTIKQELLRIGDDKDTLSRDISSIEKSFLSVRICLETEGKYFYYAKVIKSCSYSNLDNSLRFKYDGEDVKIVFSNNAGLKAIVNIIVSYKNKTCKEVDPSN